MENWNIVLTFAGTLAVIVGIVMEVVKKSSPELNKRYIPLMAIVLGVGVGSIAGYFTDLPLEPRLWSGFFAGAIASGLFDGAKSVKNLVTKKK